MNKNPYFLDNNSEQRLIEDITRETISAMGRKIYYIPRVNFNLDYLYGESSVTKFDGSHQLVAYVNDVNGFGGQGDLMTKFGIDLKDRIELVLSRKDFQDTITRVDSDLPRPKEGDLIYFVDSDTLFEINFVEHENPFYPLGKLYTYVLTCETFTYSNEEFETDQTFIDDVETEYTKNAFELYFTGLTGNFIVGETVFHIIGNTSDGPISPIITNADGVGQAYSWNPNTKLLILGNQSGEFNIEAGEYIYGVSSGIAAEISSYGNLELKYSHNPITDLNALDGVKLEEEKDADNIFNFDETDPFSEGNY